MTTLLERKRSIAKIINLAKSLPRLISRYILPHLKNVFRHSKQIKIGKIKPGYPPARDIAFYPRK